MSKYNQAYAVPVSAPPIVQGYAVNNGSTSDSSPRVYGGRDPTYDVAGKQYLMNEGFPSGLADTMISNLNKCTERFFVIDDSGSMSTPDGNRLEQTSRGLQRINCSRWNELKPQILWHAKFANIAQAKTEFRLLNGAEPIVIGDKEDDGNTLRLFQTIMESGPRGLTPLCKHINEIARKIRQMAPRLRQNRELAVVTVYSDGVASDGTLSSVIRSLEGLPVWIVIRLCTDSEDVVNYWNDIDQNVELELDVLDDLFGEAEEVMSVNKWLVYGNPLHKLREFGIPKKELDLLDEAKLPPDCIREVLAMILGGKRDDYPHPQVDPRALMAKVKEMLTHTPNTINPLAYRRGPQPWINLNKLASQYGGSNCTIM